jgi:hypothetical protein
MNTDDIRIAVLDRKKSRKSNITKILDQRTFREAAILAKWFLPSQSYGEVLNTWFRKTFNWEKNSANSRIGDDKVFGIYNAEVKASLCDDGKTCHYVQIRLTHEIDFYFLPTYNFETDKTHFFLLNKNQMKEMIVNYGGYAHGTKSEKGKVIDNINNADIEYALRPNIKSKDNSMWKKLCSFEIKEEDINEIEVWKKRKEE